MKHTSFKSELISESDKHVLMHVGTDVQFSRAVKAQLSYANKVPDGVTAQRCLQRWLDRILQISSRTGKLFVSALLKMRQVGLPL